MIRARCTPEVTPCGENFQWLRGVSGQPMAEFVGRPAGDLGTTEWKSRLALSMSSSGIGKFSPHLP